MLVTFRNVVFSKLTDGRVRACVRACVRARACVCVCLGMGARSNLYVSEWMGG